MDENLGKQGLGEGLGSHGRLGYMDRVQGQVGQEDGYEARAQFCGRRSMESAWEV